MRDLAVFTSKPISSHELVEFVREYSLRVGQPFEKRTTESFVGSVPDLLYISDSTAATEGYFSEEEKADVELALGAAPEGCVSIHFKTDTALRLAEGMAQELCRLWVGIIDYSGAGGELGQRPP